MSQDRLPLVASSMFSLICRASRSVASKTALAPCLRVEIAPGRQALAVGALGQPPHLLRHGRSPPGCRAAAPMALRASRLVCGYLSISSSTVNGPTVLSSWLTFSRRHAIPSAMEVMPSKPAVYDSASARAS